MTHATRGWSSPALGAEGAASLLDDDSMRQLLKKLRRGPDFSRDANGADLAGTDESRGGRG